MLISHDATETMRKVYTDLYQANMANNVHSFVNNLKNMQTLCTQILSEVEADESPLTNPPKSPTATPPESSSADPTT